MKQGMASLRQWWDGSIPAKLDDSRLSLIYSELDTNIFLAWFNSTSEPQVYWYTSQQEHVFRDFSTYLKFIVAA